MKDKRFLLGLLVTALALSLTAVGCEEPETADPALNGTWVNDSGSQTYKFDNGSYESEQSMTTTYYSGPYYRGKGTYSTDGNKINWGDYTYEYNGAWFVALRDALGASSPAMYSTFQSRWYSQKEYEDIMRPYQQQTTPTTPAETYTSLGTTYAVYDSTLILTYTSKKDSDGSITTSSTTYTKMGGLSGGNSGGSGMPAPPTNNQY
jgi:hypothetical protein